MRRIRAFLGLGWISTCIMAAPIWSQETVTPQATGTLSPEMKQAVANWDDFLHYLHVLRPEMVKRTGEAFLGMNLPPERFVRVVEELSRYKNDNAYQQVLDIGMRVDGEIGAQALAAHKALVQARLALVRKPERIMANIMKLNQGERPRLNARRELQVAGEYASTYMLRVLQSTEAKHLPLHSYVRQEMVEVGQPLVVPLCEALPHLTPVIKQQVAQALSQIGYPVALPYLKRELDAEQDAGTKKVLEVAFNRVLRGQTTLGDDVTADRLFLLWAENYYYQRESLVLEPEAQTNAVWFYHKDNGLSYVKVPTPSFHDARCMLMAAAGLKLNRDLSSAYSLWVASNFRRVNNLPEGKEDKSYGPPFYPDAMGSPEFFGHLSGPLHLHPALDRALRDQDAELALDLIRALRHVANSTDLANAKSQIQPLVAAMNYPDQRVRFEAAEAIAHARPRTKFNGDQRVVPVLAEAIQGPTDIPHGLLIVEDNIDSFNSTISILEDSGEWALIKGASIESKLQEIYESPRINLIVINTTPVKAVAAVAAARVNHKTQSAPVLVLTDADQMLSVNRALEGQPGIFVAPVEGNDDGLKEAVQRAVAYGKGVSLTDDQSQDYAVRSLKVLSEMAIESSDVFTVLDAKSAAIGALKDGRSPVALGAAKFISRLPTADSQHALLAASLAGDGGEDVQAAMFMALASSSRTHGNQLNEQQLKDLSDFLRTSFGSVADAAAAAWGALNQPTAKGLTEGIVGKP